MLTLEHPYTHTPDTTDFTTIIVGAAMATVIVLLIVVVFVVVIAFKNYQSKIRDSIKKNRYTNCVGIYKNK